jgi:kynurenine formamidase
MKLIDLSHTLENSMPVFPGDDSPRFKKVMTHQHDGVQVIRMDLATHHGTHIDCPRHFYENGLTTDSAQLQNFHGKALRIDCRMFAVGDVISLDYLTQLDVDWDEFSWVVLFTGWSKFWGSKKYVDDFPALSREAAKFLVEKKIKGIGLDVISIDAIHSTDYPIHNIILGSGLFVIENLTNLHLIPTDVFTLSAFPLKIKAGDGSPVRAVAHVD